MHYGSQSIAIDSIVRNSMTMGNKMYKCFLMQFNFIVEQTILLNSLLEI